MKIKRVLQGTALTALAAAAWMGAGSTDASAAVDPANGVKFGNSALTITADSGDLEIMTSVASVNTNKKTVKISSWDVYEGHEATVDLSKLNVTKDNYIAVKTDDMEKPFLVKISAAVKQTKATVDNINAKIGTLKTKEGTASLADVPAGTKIQLRTAVGSYSAAAAYDSYDLSIYQQQGATLYVRIPEDSKTNTNLLPEAEGIADYSIYNVGSLPGKEAKVNVKKLGNAPKVSVDYVSGTITITDKMEYRVVASTLPATGDAIKGTGKTEVDKLLGNAQKAVVEVRKLATTKAPASKWARIELSAPSLLATAGDTGVFKQIAGIATDDAIVVSGDSIKAEVSFTDSKKGKNGAHTYTHIVIKNSGSATIEVEVGDTKKSLAKKGTLKLTKDSANGKEVKVRVAGNKKDSKWATAWASAGTITFPADVEATN